MSPGTAGKRLNSDVPIAKSENAEKKNVHPQRKTGKTNNSEPSHARKGQPNVHETNFVHTCFCNSRKTNIANEGVVT